MIESPKTRFLKTPAAKKLFEMMTDPAVIAGLDAALLQMTYNTGTARDQAAAIANHYQLTGANRFREIFLTIAEAEKPAPKRLTDNLPNEV